MSGKLEDQLIAGERVVFRSRYGVLAIVTAAIVIAFILAAVTLLFVLSTGGAVNDIGDVLLTILFSAVFIVSRMMTQRVLVTNFRILYRHGRIRRTVEGVRLDEIRKVNFVPAFGNILSGVSVERQNGEVFGIGGVPRVLELQNVIAELCGLPPPNVDQTVSRCYGFWNAAGIICMLASMVGFFILSWQYFESVRTDISLVDFYVTVAALPLLLIAAMLVGGTIGSLLALYIMSFVLTVDQARQLVCLGYPKAQDDLLVKFSRWGSRQFAKFLSRIYGQEIRCD